MRINIKETKELYERIIATTTEGLKLLRANCPHEHTFEGVYQWRVGATYRAIICDDCGEVVKNLDFEFMNTGAQTKDGI
jgi:hypothetical protein